MLASLAASNAGNAGNGNEAYKAWLNEQLGNLYEVSSLAAKFNELEDTTFSSMYRNKSEMSQAILSGTDSLTDLFKRVSAVNSKFQVGKEFAKTTMSLTSLDSEQVGNSLANAIQATNATLLRFMKSAMAEGAFKTNVRQCDCSIYIVYL